MKRVAKLNANTPRNLNKVLRFLGVNNLQEARRQLGGRYVEGRLYADRTLFTRLKQIYNEGVRAHQQGIQTGIQGPLHDPRLDRFLLLRDVKYIFERMKGRRISIVITQSRYHDIVLNPQLIPNYTGRRWKQWFYGVQNNLSLRLYQIAIERAEQGIGGIFEAKISFTEYIDIPEERLLQIFADNRTQTCLLDPIEEWIHGMKEGKHKETYRRKIAKYKQKYPDGVPETDLQSIADNLAIGINIDIPFSKEPFIRIRSKCKSTQKKTFKYLNLCENHVVYNKTFDCKFSLTGEPIYKSMKELNQMVKSSTKDGEVWWFQGREGIHKVIKDDKIYMYQDPYNDAVEDFKKENNMRMIEFDLLENPTLTNFVFDSIHQITHYDGPAVDFDNKVQKIDQTKAYATAWKHTKFFEGFVGKITDFRKASKLDGIGFYYVKEFFDLPEFLKYKIKDKVVYASPMLRYLQSKGVSFKITHKAVGTKFNFEGFNDTMITNKYYQKYIGQIQHSSTHNRVYFNGSVKFGNHLQWCLQDTDISVFKCRNSEYEEMMKKTHYKMNEYMIEYKRDKDFGCPQFASFLIAYQNISMLEQLEKMDSNKICRVAVDGIYYHDHDFDLLPAFRKEDDTIIPDCITGSTFFSRMEEQDPPDIVAEERDHHETELWIGAGGMGKTYSHMTDPGFINIMYLAPDHDVRADKEEEFRRPTFCYQMVLANDINSEKLRNIRNKYNVVVVDECSKLNNKIKFELLEKLKGLKIIFLGDIRENGSYQLPPLEGRVMDFTGFDFVGKFEGINRRFKDQKQHEIANHLRQMEELACSAEEKMKYALSMYENVDKQYVIDNYKPTDTMLCSLHEIKDTWTECLKGEKYRCKCSRNGHFVGQIAYEKQCAKDWDYQHGFTIHSVEGKTIEGGRTLYIDTRNFFQPQMLYTAISRARYSSQIKLVVGEEPLKFCEGYIYKITNNNMTYVGSTFDPKERWNNHQKGNNTASKKVIDGKMEIVWQGRVPYRIINGKRHSKTLLSKEDEFIKSCENVNQKLNVA